MKLKRKRAPRNSQGAYIVEVVVAMMVGAMITFALLDISAMAMRHGTSTQNEVYANTIVRQILDSLKQANYSKLASNIGQHTLLTNRTTAGQLGPAVRELPLQIDTVSKSWENSSVNGRFRGDVTLTIEAGPTPNSLTATVEVSWRDGKNYQNSAKRTVTKSTTIFSRGMKSWE